MNRLRHTRWYYLLVGWLTLSAWGPIEEGTEAGAEGSGGVYEISACGTTDRIVHAGLKTSYNYRPKDTPFYVGAEGIAIAQMKVAKYDEETEKRTYNHSRAMKGWLVSPHAGLQTSFLKLEAGVLSNIEGGRPGFAPEATIGIRPLPRHSFEATWFHQEPIAPTTLLTAGYVYAGPNWRFRTGPDLAFASGWRSEVERKVGERNWLGLGVAVRVTGVFGPSGAAVIKYRWSDSKPMPENWSEVQKPDFLLRPIQKDLD